MWLPGSMPLHAWMTSVRGTDLPSLQLDLKQIKVKRKSRVLVASKHLEEVIMGEFRKLGCV